MTLKEISVFLAAVYPSKGSSYFAQVLSELCIQNVDQFFENMTVLLINWLPKIFAQDRKDTIYSRSNAARDIQPFIQRNLFEPFFLAALADDLNYFEKNFSLLSLTNKHSSVLIACLVGNEKIAMKLLNSSLEIKPTSQMLTDDDASMLTYAAYSGNDVFFRKLVTYCGLENQLEKLPPSCTNALFDVSSPLYEEFRLRQKSSSCMR